MNPNGNGHRNGHPDNMHGHDDDQGQGQSGYGSGRLADDRSMAFRNRNQEVRPGERDQHWTDRESRDMRSESGGDREWGRTQRPPGPARPWNPSQQPQRVSHQGKGPKGYQRSDERIREHVCEVLTDSHDIDASNIDVAVKDGEVILTGTVEDRNAKRMAEDHIWQLSGVKDVQNNLKVGNPSSSAGVGKHETETNMPGGTSKHRA